MEKARVSPKEIVPSAPVTKEILLLDLYRKIVNREIDNFDKLKSYIHIRCGKIDLTILNEGFHVLKKTFWGAFSNLSKEKFPKLWSELVIADKEFPDYGELKRNMSISEIYVGVFDIHGYTAFCQRAKKNINLLHRLDKFLNVQVVSIAEKYGAIARRERGDEIVVIGAEPDSMVAVCFDIIQSFSKPKVIKVDNSNMNGELITLPPFEISAGIAGGQSQTPLIVTMEGELSGFLINCAARLQSRANTLSPKKTKVIVEQFLVYRLSKQTACRFEILKDKRYFYNGEVAFKGVSLKSYEVFTNSHEEFYKFKIEPFFRELEAAIDGNHWQGKIFMALCNLIIVTANSMPKFEETVQMSMDKKILLKNDMIAAAFMDILNKFQGNFLLNAFEKFDEICDIIEESSSFDPLVKEYCINVRKVYEMPIKIYRDLFYDFLKSNKSKLFDESELRLYDGFHQLQSGFQRLLNKCQSSDKIVDKIRLWHNAIENSRNHLSLEIYSGKK